MKYLISKYHGFLGLTAAILIFGSWILTTTLQENLDSLEKSLSSLAFEYRLGKHLDSIEILERSTNYIVSRSFVNGSFSLEVIDKKVSLENDENIELASFVRQRSVFQKDDEVKDLYRMYMGASKSLLASYELFYSALIEIGLEYNYQENYETSITDLKEANREIENGNKKYESSFFNTFGPNWPVPVGKEDYEVFLDFQSDYVLQLSGGTFLLDGLRGMLIDSKNKFYSTMVFDRNQAKRDLEFVKQFSLWAYALGTLLAILSKVGEFYREKNGS